MSKFNLKKEIWEEAKPAECYPKDWCVIPALDVNKIFDKFINRLKEKFIRMDIVSGKVITYEIDELVGDLK